MAQTLEEFAAESAEKQRLCIRQESDKIQEIRAAWDSYVELTHGHGMHPLDGAEIWQRELELKAMTERVGTDFSPGSPAIVAAYALQYGESN